MFEHAAVAALFADYAAGNDGHDEALLRSAFADRGRMSVDVRGTAAMGPFEGAGAIVDFLRSSWRDDAQNRHVLTNIRSVDEGGASVGYAYLSMLATDESGPTAQTTGVYRGEIVDEDGRPCFSSLQLSLDAAP